MTDLYPLSRILILLIVIKLTTILVDMLADFQVVKFVAERKNITFESNVAIGDLIVMGDPGRVRQILTNLLTNSIKFTSEGSVKLSVWKRRETTDTIEIEFVVKDSVSTV